MKQQEIDYSKIIDLGFTEKLADDKIYERQYGYKWVIIQKELTPEIYVEWTKENRVCEIVKTDGEHNIKARHPIKDLDQLKTIINFFEA